jgi:predicted aminopeptidase
MGCVGYRGYFQRAPADQLAAELRAQGLDVSVYGVPAYSTLGWTNWLGGDPLLSTFIRWPESELARLLFHELAHQVVYVADDTAFNESFATAVERLGLQRWLAGAGAAAQQDAAALEARRKDFRRITAQARADLQALYRSRLAPDALRERKAERLRQLREDHARLKAGPWQGFAGYDAWFAQVNNAALAVHGAYEDLVPAFEALFERQGRDFTRFYAEVRRLAALPAGERRAALLVASTVKP